VSPALQAEVELAAEYADEHCLRPEEIDRLLRGAPWRRFAVLGDSIAEGLGEEVPGYGPGSWGERVAEALRRQQPALEYLNLGERYRKAAEVRATQLSRAIAFRPDLVAVVCGGNDVLEPHFDAGALENELETLLAPFVASGAAVITFTLLDITRAIELPAKFGEHVHTRLGLLADMMRELAARHRTIHVELRPHPASADPGIYSSDRMHANRRGHAIVASATVKELGAHLRRQPTAA
jgi:lysophospholipase L1-like esterase